MLLLKKEESKASSFSPFSLKADSELTFLEQLQFSFDMDSEPHKGSPYTSHPRDTRRTRSSSASMGGSHNVIQSDAHHAALLAQFAAAAGTSSHDLSPINPYGSPMPQEDSHSNFSRFHDHLFDHGDVGHAQLSSLSFLDLSWHHLPPQLPIHLDHPANLERTFSNPGTLIYPDASSSLPLSTSKPPENHPSKCSSSAKAVASSSISTASPEQDEAEGDRNVTAEEKRRRNTAASDLTGRAEDLEREAADLRRENGWLKEIVMLKGSRLAGMNLASHFLAESAQRVAEAPSQSAASSSTSGSKVADPGSDDASSDEEEAKARKSKKGKSRKE
ncbi:hypothetical protein D9615_005121 [Tricholomella constricta]|uniref:BZIP domain-containing protein n=1 Tax=Tricholomella constricta TaxID=117010 RepID=A0A8H5H6E9_9AGAR|nr:hypothetical protein D9615_005121 [Tricholomella constricta]